MSGVITSSSPSFDTGFIYSDRLDAQISFDGSKVGMAAVKEQS